MRVLITTLLLITSMFSHAATVTIDFEGVTAVRDWQGELSGVESKGFTFFTDSWFGGFPEDNGVSADGIYTSTNCEYVVGCGIGIYMESIDGGVFSIHSFDTAGSDLVPNFRGRLTGGASANLTVPVGTGDWLQLQQFSVNWSFGGQRPYGTPGGYLYLDDIVVSTAVPVPAAVWLFGSGLGLLGWLRHRRVS